MTVSPYFLTEKCRTHEDLEEKSHTQDRQIETLLNQFDTLRTDQKIKWWMSKAHSDNQSVVCVPNTHGEPCFCPLADGSKFPWSHIIYFIPAIT
jgi:hypothetical protein